MRIARDVSRANKFRLNAVELNISSVTLIYLALEASKGKLGQKRAVKSGDKTEK